MIRAKVECRFEYKGYPCVVVMQPGAFRTGYVGLSPTNHFYNYNYDDINEYIDCHGGLTYGSERLIDQDDEDIWWIGFDTAHYMDGHDFKGAIELYKYDEEVLSRLHRLESIYTPEYFYAWTREDIKKELMYIVDQIEEF